MELWAMRTKPLLPEEAVYMLNALPHSVKEMILKSDGQPRPQSLWAYSLLKLALRDSYHLEFPELSRTEEGKPYFPGYPDIQFNISHTRGAVLVGLSDRQIGVDIEWKRTLSQRLQELLQAEGEEALAAWVKWEACAKCMGQGVLPLLRRGTLPEEITYREIHVFPDYCAGVAGWGEWKELTVHHVEPETLCGVLPFLQR